MRTLDRLLSFIIIGVIIAIVIGLLNILAHVVLLGVLIGSVLFSISWLKNKLFPNKQRNYQYHIHVKDFRTKYKPKTGHKNKNNDNSIGRIIDAKSGDKDKI